MTIIFPHDDNGPAREVIVESVARRIADFGYRMPRRPTPTPSPIVTRTNPHAGIIRAALCYIGAGFSGAVLAFLLLGGAS